MWDDYKACFVEPGVADTIIMEAQEKLREQFTSDIKETLDEAREAEARLKSIQTEIREAEYHLRELEEKCERASALVDEIDQYHLPRGFAKKLVSALTGDFAPGDKCWIVDCDTTRLDCPICNGKKKVTADVSGRKVKITCPKCNGFGYMLHQNYLPKEGTVKEVSMKLCVESDRVGVWSYDTIELYGYERAYKADDLYKTLEECKVECDKKNAKSEDI